MKILSRVIKILEGNFSVLKRLKEAKEFLKDVS
jgi:hypothetical protein